MRAPKFHVFPAYALAWPDVQPGDVIISPEARFFRMNDWYDRDDTTKGIITKFRPMLVLARIDGVFGEDALKCSKDTCTFVVYSISKGFLITAMSVLEERPGRQ